MFEWWNRLPIIYYAPDNDGGGGGDTSGEGGGSNADGGDGSQGSDKGSGDGKAADSGSLLDRASKQGGEGGEGSGDTGAKDGTGSDADGDGAGTGDAPSKLVLKERPDWLEEGFHDAKTGEVDVEKLAKSRAELRAKMGKGDHKAPAKPADYKFELREDLKSLDGRLFKPDEKTGEDPIITKFRDFAHERGWSQEFFHDAINWYAEQMGDLFPPPVDQDVEMKKLGQNAQKLIDQTNGFGERLKGLGLFGDHELAEFRLCCTSAAGVKMLQAIRNHYGEQSVPVVHATEAAATESGAELAAETGKIMTELREGKITEQQADARHAALMQKFEKVYGTDPAGSSVVPNA